MTLYMRPNCGLCGPVIESLEALGIVYRSVDVSLDAGLEIKYGWSVPVVEQGGVVVFEGGMDPLDLPSLIGGP
ncbi:MAG: glutaredoxin [Actinomycetota bacterium]